MVHHLDTRMIRKWCFSIKLESCFNQKEATYLTFLRILVIFVNISMLFILVKILTILSKFRISMLVNMHLVCVQGILIVS
jgi:hypothetical protein